MRYLYGLALVFCIVLWSSCRNDFDNVPNSGNLEFSQDTIYLDTVFTNIGSSTRTLKVYNRSSEDINIPNIQDSLSPVPNLSHSLILFYQKTN